LCCLSPPIVYGKINSSVVGAAIGVAVKAGTGDGVIVSIETTGGGNVGKSVETTGAG
jgi:hypothetical protein